MGFTRGGEAREGRCFSLKTLKGQTVYISGESRWYQDDFSEIWRPLRWNIFRPVLIKSETLCFNLVFWINRNEVCWRCGDNNNKCFIFYSVIFSSPHFLLIEHTTRLSFCPRLICHSSGLCFSPSLSLTPEGRPSLDPPFRKGVNPVVCASCQSRRVQNTVILERNRATPRRNSSIYSYFEPLHQWKPEGILRVFTNKY